MKRSELTFSPWRGTIFLICVLLLGMGQLSWAVARVTPKGVALTTPDGGPVANATVKITFNSETQTGQTDDDGNLAIVVLGGEGSQTQGSDDEDFTGIVLRGDGVGILEYEGAPEGGERFEVSGGVLTVTGAAAAAALTGSQSALGSTVTDVVVASRVGVQGQPTLAVAVPSSYGQKPVDQVSVELSKKPTSQAQATTLPDGWSMERDGKKLKFHGAASVDYPIALQVGLGGQPAPETTKVELYAGKDRLYKETVQVQPLKPVTPLKPDQALQLPPAVSAGQEVVFEPFESAALPRWGAWSISGLEPIRIGGTDPTSYRFSVPHDWVSGLKLQVSYRDVWGEELVQGTTETAVFAPPSETPETPTITDATTRILKGGSLCICGWFPTAESRAGILMNGAPLGAPTSSSPEALIFFFHEETPPGPCDLVGSPEAGFGPEDRARTTLVGVGGSIDRNKLFRGESTPLRLEAYGTDDPITLTLRNKTPEIITIDGGVEQDVTTSGGTPNNLVKNVKGHTVGDFNIVYELEGSKCPCAEGSFPRATGGLAKGL